MYNSYDIVEAIRQKIEHEHLNGYEIQKIILSDELYEIMCEESDTGSIVSLLGYTVQRDPNVHTFSFIMYNMLN